MNAILQLNQLIRQFGEAWAVKGISFEIGEGEIFSLLGPNGAGKTTTISMLSTLLAPTKGDATIGGYSITKRPNEVRKIIGIVPQEIALYDELTAQENLNFWGQLYGLSGSQLKTRVSEALEHIGLADKAKQRVSTFSGGMKRRVNIAAGLLHRPRVLFMDEPTVGVDPQSRRAILDMVKNLNKQGMTVLYTTHYMEEAEELSNRIGIMDHGELIAIGTRNELIRQIEQSEILQLQFGEDVNTTPIAQAIRQMKDVKRVDTTDRAILVMVPNAAVMIAPVVAKVSETGARIKALEVKEPNLEAVFLNLTGRALRD
ncbi:MAG TPA: ATP-binding cassette domain-containing protein [Thermoflexales bacterium]|nr:ATP-binding cassette domain-containing protein [Thermoflexales bacterium]HQW34603.1 ATP-binding cassette domain-containing protein [Thermoflexales bacterium]HRA01197.1 ATP-binding cassette domain-containing protein [Thermoflexales bacterium]